MNRRPDWMDYVQVGDQILCTGVRNCSNPKTASRLTPGKSYEVRRLPESLGWHADWVVVKNDSGKDAGYAAKWFSFSVPAGRNKRQLSPQVSRPILRIPVMYSLPTPVYQGPPIERTAPPAPAMFGQTKRRLMI